MNFLRRLHFGAALAVIGYGVVIYYFSLSHFYYSHFFSHGVAVSLYQLMRSLFMIYLWWLIYAPGACALLWLERMGRQGAVAGPERYPLAFLLGAGIWLAALFPLGLQGLYTKPVALAATALVMLASVRHLARLIEHNRSAVAHFRPAMVFYVFLAVAWLFLLIKGLYPAGGHDYYNHYFPFYLRVIETGSTLPNDVWYHFYYSKGEGLYFLSMLLTDPLAPQLVTTTFIFTACWIVFLILKRAASASLLPWMGAIFYLLFLIYTPGPLHNAWQGGWGDMEKQHEEVAVLVLGMVWCLMQLWKKDTPRAPWMAALLLSVVAVALLNTLLLAMLGCYFALVLALALFSRNRTVAAAGFFAGALCAVAFVAMLALNYAYTGAPFDNNGILYGWRWLDLEKLARWGVLFEAMFAHQSHTKMLMEQVPFNAQALVNALTFLRMEIWWPLLLLPLAAAVKNLRTTSGRKELLAIFSQRHAWLPLMAFMAVVVAFGLSSSARAQPVSFYRMASFSYAPVLCACLLLWQWLPAHWLSARYVRRATLAGLGIGLAVVAWLQSPWVPENPGAQLARKLTLRIGQVYGNASQLAIGAYSLRDAYQNQQGWPGRMPWGAIYPAMEPVWNITGPGARIWSFHVHSYCMLPNCRVESFMSNRFSSQWLRVFFGSPDEGASALKAEGLNYFFFSSGLSLQGPYTQAPVLSPDHIARHLAIRWSDGISYLLTWNGSPNTKPIDAPFLAAYRKSIEESQTANLSADWEPIAAYLSQQKTLAPFTPPWCVNCEGLSPLPPQR